MKTKIQILNRAFVLLILSDRGLLEKEYHEGERYSKIQREEQKNRFIEIVNKRKLMSFFSKKEKKILFSKIGSLDEDLFYLTQFQYESIQALLWSISITDFPKYDDNFCSIDFHHYIGKYGTSNFKLNATLKNINEIEVMREVSMLWHWRVRGGIDNDFFISINLKKEIVKIFGKDFKSYIKKIPLSKKKPVDFLVDKKLFSNLPNKSYNIISIKAQWVHHALEWIINDETWEETDTST